MPFWIGKLLNIAAFGTMSLSSYNLVWKTALFGNNEAGNEKWVSGCTLLLISGGTICSFLGRLKLIFCSIAGSPLFCDQFHAQSWLVTAVLFCWIFTHTSGLNRRVATDYILIQDWKKKQQLINMSYTTINNAHI